ncbi:MAG TPA: glycosyltransferase family 2 protein [Gammaproteobacteria bacterium]|nr:glycosyltransferase family 2 protein [Gammaproteobacteria bacterium]
MTTLSISIVTYHPDMVLLSRCIESLDSALGYASTAGVISGYSLTLIDNSIDSRVRNDIAELLDELWHQPGNKPQLVTTASNLGYGLAHNLGIKASKMDYHLLLNPDVLFDKPALHNAIQFMKANRNVALLTPGATNNEGDREYLNKRYPGILVLLIRGFAPQAVKRMFRKIIASYEMQELDQDKVHYDIELASGCFMLFRTGQLQQLGGFSEKFFLYFEDYDLSMRTREYGDIAYVPDVRIVHYGGGAARKGIRHVFLFIRSAITFFNLHGWKLK